eukprot:CAMPEP_0119530506 /NCGR_PEP_ID=MMETSP1344-20130328/44349_1 /TAXON_ID=236787 /ORGANISM="Florenciella parvula, Strain CCMP2471" /LENGTH=58 /DNA_ID=CAMNT_0007570479 /DNA_START=9 /DNA_END=185 /DNA_ORIENTATION=+
MAAMDAGTPSTKQRVCGNSVGSASQPTTTPPLNFRRRARLAIALEHDPRTTTTYTSRW